MPWPLDGDSHLFSSYAGPSLWQSGDNDTSKSQCHAAIHAGASPSEPVASGAVADGDGSARAWRKGGKNRARPKGVGVGAVGELSWWPVWWTRRRTRTALRCNHAPGGWRRGRGGGPRAGELGAADHSAVTGEPGRCWRLEGRNLLEGKLMGPYLLCTQRGGFQSLSSSQLGGDARVGI